MPLTSVSRLSSVYRAWWFSEWRAVRAGLRPFRRESSEPGDIIVAADGKPTPTLADLAQALEDAGIGKEIAVRVRRGNAERDVNVRVVDLPD